ncbi:MAG TPA: N-acetylmuramoyl-L-alanine amidase [Myxococcota bacterium]|nr:N-acetylmuramoyl-L-alanine amidase [Myxococcota bacterium]HRY96119.1 N-acetylmuramoyl-L-alanine amidase [Myxococcota bacterium]
MSALRLLTLGLGLLLALPAAGGPPVARPPAAPRAAAARPAEEPGEAAYQQARRAYYRFKDDPAKQKLRHHWKRVAGMFDEVARAHPASARAADALFTSGRMYLDLYKISRLPEDQEAALARFTRLVEGYPKSRLADDGQLHVSLHWLEVKKDQARAIATLTYLLEQFPHGDVAPKARRMLEDLGGPAADDPEPKAARAGPRPEPGGERKGPDKVEAEARPEPSAEGEGPVLADVQVDSSPDYTRITLHTGAACTYKWGTLPPDGEHTFPRLYVDLKGTALDPQLKGPIEVRDSVVRRIRLAPFQRGVTRVVVDLKSLGDHKVFPMDTPARVVMDVSGSTDRTARELGKPTERVAVKVEDKPAGKPAPDPAATAVDGGTEVDAGPVKTAGKADAGTEAGADLDGVIARAMAPDGGPPSAGPGERVAAVGEGDEGEGEGEGEVEEIEEPEPAPPPRGKKVRRPGSPVPKSMSKPGQSLSMLAGLKVRRVVIDPGHGGRDPGAIGKGGTLEKDVTLDLAKRLAKLLKADKELGLKQVVLTRTKDEFLALEKRTALANKLGADLFISLHCNAHRNRKFRGVETFYLDLTDDRYSIRLAARENATSEKTISDLKFILADLALKSHVDDSIALGESIQRAAVGTLKRSYKKVKDLRLKPALFYVLIGARMPSVLMETSFISNEDEEKLLNTSDYKDKLVKGIHQGLKNFIQARDEVQEPG